MEMGNNIVKSCTVFNGDKCVASGNLKDVAGKVKEIIDQDKDASILIFDDETSEVIEVNFRGTIQDVLKRVEAATNALESSDTLAEKDQRQGPGRPKLGVVSREVTLLPRHWEWLNSQPGGASVALRKLVEEARKANSDKDRVRKAQEATYRFMTTMAGNLPGYEEATRALYAGDSDRYKNQIASWPADIRAYAIKLSVAAFEE
jgi:uncharacterized protein